MKKSVALLLVLLLAAGGAYWTFKPDTASQEGGPPGGFGGPGGPGGMGAPPVVVVEQVQRAILSDEIEAIGTALANESVTLTAKVTERVSKVRFEDGQAVEAGDILVELTRTEERALLAESEATLNDARRQLRRLEDLVRQGSVPLSQVDEARSRVEAQEARFDALTARLDDRLIRAPFGGMLGFRDVSEGTLVTPGTAITTLDDISVIKLDFSVPEVFLGSLERGLTVSARSAAYRDREFTGEVTSVGSRVDRVSRAATVRAVIANDDGVLRPGMLMTVRLTTAERDALVVPERATVQIDRRTFVFVAEEGHAIRRQIVTGARRDGMVEVVSGLSVGEHVVTDGVIKVRDGGRIMTNLDAPRGAPGDMAGPPRATVRGAPNAGGPP
jgi:membrane fusion protein, multidrug efflux system